MSKICSKHPESKRYKYRCAECGREKARVWNIKNRDVCIERNNRYTIEKKEKIAARKKELYDKNPEKYKLQARQTMLKKKYRLSLAEYDNMLERQNGVCGICGKKETVISNKKGGVDRLRVDHCHKTGEIRGLLCSNCNFGIGHFKDDVSLLRNAILYLS